jgi:hypothetical protein
MPALLCFSFCHLGRVPSFVVLYLPIILPFFRCGLGWLWYDWGGCCEFLEGLGAWIEAYDAVVYVLNWVLMPRDAAEGKMKAWLLLGVYVDLLLAPPTFFGTSSRDFSNGLRFVYSITPTFALNYVIMAVVCLVLLRSVSPRLKAWGVYGYLDATKTSQPEILLL